MSDKTELRCDACGKHIGWYTSSQPRGGVLCDDCSADEDDRERKQEQPAGDPR